MNAIPTPTGITRLSTRLVRSVKQLSGQARPVGGNTFPAFSGNRIDRRCNIKYNIRALDLKSAIAGKAGGL